MAGAMFLASCFFSLRLSALEPTGCEVGPGIGAKVGTSGQAHTNKYSLGRPLLVSLPPQWATVNLCLLRRPSKTAGRSSLVSYGGNAFCWDPVHMSTRDLVCPLQELSLFFSQLLSFGATALGPSGLQVQYSGGSSTNALPSDCLGGLFLCGNVPV